LAKKHNPQQKRKSPQPARPPRPPVNKNPMTPRRPIRQPGR